MTKSKKFTVNKYDILKAIVVGSGTGVAMFIQQCMDAKDFVFHWQAIGMAAVGGMITYLIKNFFTVDK